MANELTMSSTVLRDWERCPERARLLWRSGAYEEGREGRHTIYTAAGVAFDALAREALLKELERPAHGVVDQAFEWLPPTLRPQALAIGHRLFDAYRRSGAYQALLKEGIENPNPPIERVCMPLLAEGKSVHPAVPVRVRPDCFLRGCRLAPELHAPKGSVYLSTGAEPKGHVIEPAYPQRLVCKGGLLDWKTSGIVKGASPPAGWKRRWRGGVDLGADAIRTPDRPDWQTQLKFYALVLGRFCVGIDLVAVAAGWRRVDVAQYRWELSAIEARELGLRIRACYENLTTEPERPKQTFPTRGRCHAYASRCEAADDCVYYARLM